MTGGAILLDDRRCPRFDADFSAQADWQGDAGNRLFNDTVRNNIAYGQPDVPMSRIEAALYIFTPKFKYSIINGPRIISTVEPAMIKMPGSSIFTPA